MYLTVAHVNRSAKPGAGLLPKAYGFRTERCRTLHRTENLAHKTPNCTTKPNVANFIWMHLIGVRQPLMLQDNRATKRSTIQYYCSCSAREIPLRNDFRLPAYNKDKRTVVYALEVERRRSALLMIAKTNDLNL
jgi:hypothetical protein